jgi:hypothetical protein
VTSASPLIRIVLPGFSDSSQLASYAWGAANVIFVVGVQKLVPSLDAAQVALAEDQHPVGHLGPDGAHEPLRVGVRARAAQRDLHDLDAGAGQDRVEGAGVLPGAVADEEPEACGAVAEVHQEVADLLGRPRAIGVRGDPKDMHVAGTDLDDEQAVQAPEGDRAVHVEEVGGEHGRGLDAKEVPVGAENHVTWPDLASHRWTGSR